MDSLYYKDRMAIHLDRFVEVISGIFREAEVRKIHLLACKQIMHIAVEHVRIQGFQSLEIRFSFLVQRCILALLVVVIQGDFYRRIFHQQKLLA